MGAACAKAGVPNGQAPGESSAASLRSHLGGQGPDEGCLHVRRRGWAAWGLGAGNRAGDGCLRRLGSGCGPSCRCVWGGNV